MVSSSIEETFPRFCKIRGLRHTHVGRLNGQTNSTCDGATNSSCWCPACNRDSMARALPGPVFCARPRACSFECAAFLLRAHDQHAGLRQPCGYFTEKKLFIVHTAHHASAGGPSCSNASQSVHIHCAVPPVG